MDVFLAEFSTFLIGVTIVFVTLLMLILLIEVLSSVVAKMEKKEEKIVKETPVTISEPVQEESENLIDELELVAVITAAIAASMGTTSDKLQVRSLRQVTRQVR